MQSLPFKDDLLPYQLKMRKVSLAPAPNLCQKQVSANQVFSAQDFLPNQQISTTNLFLLEVPARDLSLKEN